MPLRTKALREPAEPADGERWFVARYWPRGQRKGSEPWARWERRLAPSAALLRDLKGKGGVSAANWPEFALRYLTEMEAAPARAARAELAAALARGETITILCYCREPERCHRTLLAGLFEPGAGA